MRTIPRRRLFTVAGMIAGGAGLAALARQAAPPSEAWVRERLWGDKLLAYAVWDGAPRAVVQFSPGRVSYDLMIPGDWIWPNWPPAPQWQLAGLGYSIATSNSPATVGFAPCAGIAGEKCGLPIELFGQINDSEIVTMEVLVSGTWRRFAVAAPGYAIRLDGVTRAPAGYRWLDAAGRVVWDLADHSLTSPPSRRRRYHRRRKRATPVSSALDSQSAPS